MDKFDALVNGGVVNEEIPPFGRNDELLDCVKGGSAGGFAARTSSTFTSTNEGHSERSEESVGISASLPAEIEARRKQYEYYRGKLLDFKPLNS